MSLTFNFNHTTLDATLPAFHQFVNCPTRQNRTIDLLYANIKDAYTATSLPPLGKSDHNLVSLQPLYVPCVRREPITTRTVRMPSPEADEALRDCLGTTDWSVFQQSFGEDVDVKFNCVVCELIELGEVVGKVLVWEKVPPLATLEHNVNIPVAVLVTLPVPALLAVVFDRKMFGKARQVPEAAR